MPGGLYGFIYVLSLSCRTPLRGSAQRGGGVNDQPRGGDRVSA